MKARLAGKPRLEQLEDRVVPAGNVVAQVNAHGDLLFQGDRHDNQMVIQYTPTNTTVLIGLNNTTINRQQQVEFVGRPRFITGSLRQGNDVLHLIDVRASGQIRINGGAGLDYVSRNNVTARLGTRLTSMEVVENNVAGANTLRVGLGAVGLAQTTEDVMAIKLQQSIQTLTRPGQGHSAYEQAIREAMEALYTSNLVVLPTAGEASQDTIKEFERHIEMAERAIRALTVHVNNRNVGNPSTKAEAADVRNFLQLTREAMLVLGQATAQSDPEGDQPIQNNPILNATDEAGHVIDPTGITPLSARLVRSPFPILGQRGSPVEDIIITNPLANGETVTVIKETRGVVALVRPVKLPIWLEPWFARRTLVGFRTVWVWEWVPAEHVKTITMHNNNGTVETTIQTRIVLDRQLLPFWGYLNNYYWRF